MTFSRKFIVGAAVLATLSVSAGGWLAWRAHEAGELVRAIRPRAPDLREWPEELRRRVAAAGRDSLEDLAELSRLYHANGFLAEATRCYSGLEKLQPREPRWLHRHATILAGYGDAEPAMARWKTVIELAPDYIPARLKLGELLLKSERPAEAAAVYTTVLQRQSDEPYATLGLARIDVDAARWTEARARLERVVPQTNYTLGYDLLVTVYERLGESAGAAALRGRAKALGSFRDPPDPWLDELVEVCFDAYRLSLAAGHADRGGDRVRAIRLLERAVMLAPQDVSIRFQLGALLVEKGDVAKGRAELERCTAIAPTFPDAWAHLATLRERGGDRRGAEQVTLTGLRHCPESPGLHLTRARQLREAGRFGEAIAEYKASIRFRPNEADAHLELATTLFRLERVPEGVVELERAIAAEPSHPMALALLAFHAIGEGDEKRARQWLAAVLDQPRVPREQVERLTSGFRERFGRSLR